MHITGIIIQNELQDEKDKSRQHREGREKPSREEMKADKHEKASKKEEKHERIKLKRSYSPERDDRDHYRERVEWEEARGSSVASNGSSHRSHNQPSPDESPRYPDERGELTFYLLDLLCHLLITFANSLEPDQARHLVGPDLDPNCLTLIVFLKELIIKVHLKKKSAYVKKQAKLSSRQRVKLL